MSRFRATALLSLGLLAACRREAPRDPDTLVVGISTYPTDLDPRVGADQASDRFHSLVYDGLFENGPDLAPRPALVETIVLNGPLRYEFKLRAGIKFHDGRPFTSEDARFTLDSIRSGAVASFRRADLEKIAAVEAPGPLTLRLALREPFPALLTNLNFGILPSGTDPAAARKSPVGTGPWKFLTAAPGRELAFSANPDYFRGAPGMAALLLKAVPNAGVRALEMKRGALDLISDDLPADALGALARDPRFAVSARPGTGFQYLVFNCRRRPFDDPSVRRAVAALLDRETALSALYGGRGRLADSLLPVFHWAYAPPALAGALARDPASALARLDAAGLRPGRDGIRFRFTYRTASDNPETLAAAQFYQDTLRRAGIAMEIRASYWGFYFEALKKGDFDLAGGRWIGITDPDGFRLRFGSAWFPPGGLNRGGFSDPEMDRLMEAGAREGDPARRKAIYAAVQARFRAGMPYVPLFHADVAVLHRRELRGVAPPPDGSFRMLRDISRGPLTEP